MIARFEMCRCGKHGRLISSTGLVGNEVDSKPFAIAMLHSGEFTEQEVSMLKEQILQSSLTDAGAASPPISTMVDEWNAALSRGEQRDPSEFHEYF